jgi:RNA ligase (TIGR02306 family)
MRKMASIRRIDAITPIEGADKIECAHISGWKVVVNKGQYGVGELAIYCEIDSFIPSPIAPFLTRGGNEPREYNGIKGERLRTAKLRGQLSQGLLLPVVCQSANRCVVEGYSEEYGWGVTQDWEEGEDVSEFIQVQKWEPPETKIVSADAKGNFPSFIPKTDQERVQNLKNEISEHIGDSFEVTIKRDGSSLTAYVYNEKFGVCSRNLDLKDGDNTFWNAAKKYSLHEKIRATGRNLALQGEVLSTGIQGNYEKVSELEWWCFDVYDIDSQKYLLPMERQQLCKQFNIPHVQIFDADFVLDHSVDALLGLAEGPGVNKNVKREGLVFKSNTEDFSFKAISNSYLLKQKE